MDIKKLLNSDRNGNLIGFREMLCLSEDEAPLDRIPLLRKLSDGGDLALALESSCLLAAWGDKSYVDRLKNYCENRVDQKANFKPHRLRNYDQTYEYFLAALVGYWFWHEDIGQEEASKARDEIFPVIVLIVRLAGKCQFELTKLYGFIERHLWLEYLPYIRAHLKALFEDSGQHQWKFVDAINFLDKYDKEFVATLLSQYGKTRSDYPLEQ